MTTPPSLTARIDAAIRPNMLLGLQDAELDGLGGTQRISEWADWITAAVTAVVQPELDAARAENERLRQQLAHARNAAFTEGAEIVRSLPPATSTGDDQHWYRFGQSRAADLLLAARTQPAT